MKNNKRIQQLLELPPTYQNIRELSLIWGESDMQNIEKWETVERGRHFETEKAKYNIWPDFNGFSLYIYHAGKITNAGSFKKIESAVNEAALFESKH